MLQLTNICKYYQLGEERVAALDHLSVSFGSSEFVSILGSSGSGKTTLLNMIGGLDRYSEGDMTVDGKSTKDFSDHEWDSYRNGTIGFVFQSYNLIPHLSVLDNVAIALSITGVSAKERVQIAKKALKDVGLEKHILKRPNQLSGGQMQRVAIARALVNNPKILLADEPTGALDSHTSLQIMDLIKQISKDRLVIMVTHNPELANTYSDRIIHLADGVIIEDTKPFIGSERKATEKIPVKATSMSFLTALKSSYKNLVTKKTRTSITAFAGSIGIISIALVLSISTGMSAYVDTLQEDTLSGFPITIQQTSSADADRFERMGRNFSDEDNTQDADPISNRIGVEEAPEVHTNRYNDDVLGEGYTFAEYIGEKGAIYSSSISYTSGYAMKGILENSEGNYQEILVQNQRNSALLYELPTNEEYVLSQYNVVASLEEEFSYPTKMSEALLVIDESGQLTKEQIEALGYSSEDELTYQDFLGKKLYMIANDEYYEQEPDSTYFMQRSINSEMALKGTEVVIVGILQAKESSLTPILATGVGYTKELTETMVNLEANSQIVAIQTENPSLNVLSKDGMQISEQTLRSILQQLGGDHSPTQIAIYPKTFEDKEDILALIDDYNAKVYDKFGADAQAYKTNSIVYTDLAQTIAGTMTTMIDTITVILTAFAGISLVVSSIMIGIITYVSVVERTKEIGIMRAIGARKKDISRIFNAEAMIIGFISGTLGVILAVVITFPVNSVISGAIGIEGFQANLPVVQGALLIGLSIILTAIAGLIPSSIAAKKDPVEALRSE